MPKFTSRKLRPDQMLESDLEIEIAKYRGLKPVSGVELSQLGWRDALHNYYSIQYCTTDAFELLRWYIQAFGANKRLQQALTACESHPQGLTGRAIAECALNQIRSDDMKTPRLLIVRKRGYPRKEKPCS